MAKAFKSKLPEAEEYLDKLAGEAKEQARLLAPNPEPLLALVDQTRDLANR